MGKLMKSEEARDKLKLKIQMKALAFQQFMKPILNMAFKFLIFGILGMIALLAVAKVAYDIVGIMGQFGVIDDIKEIIGSALIILGAVFGMVGSFLSGDFTAMFDYLGTIMSSLMDRLEFSNYIRKGCFCDSSWVILFFNRWNILVL